MFRLSLAHNCIGDALETLLSGLERGLKLLDLSSCSLSHTDLTYLADSIHSQSLGSLSLASNELGLQWDVVVSLTHKMSSNLHILDLSSNEFVESQMMALTRMVATSPLSSLALLDLSWHPLKLSTLLDMIQLLSSKTSLRTFCLSTPVDMADAGYSELDSWQVFIDFTSQFATKHRPNRTPLMLHWCLMWSSFVSFCDRSALSLSLSITPDRPNLRGFQRSLSCPVRRHHFLWWPALIWWIFLWETRRFYTVYLNPAFLPVWEACFFCLSVFFWNKYFLDANFVASTGSVVSSWIKCILWIFLSMRSVIKDSTALFFIFT